MNSLTASSGLGLLLVGALLGFLGTFALRSVSLVMHALGVLLHVAGVILILRALGITDSFFTLLVLEIVLIIDGVALIRHSRITGSILVVVGIFGILSQNFLPISGNVGDTIAAGLTQAVKSLDTIVRDAGDVLGDLLGSR